MQKANIGGVVIPAHNEEAVIGRCLTTLLNNLDDGVGIAVVANGCTDRTAAVARSFGVAVIETDQRGKTNALNLGDRRFMSLPVIFLDADVELSGDAANQLLAELRRPGVLAAAPALTWSTAGLRWPIRAYYEVWTALPYIREGLVGSGVFGLSTEGRKRFAEFPAVIADDGFVRRLFTPDERRTLQNCTFMIHPPRTVRDLVKVKARVWTGNLQLDDLGYIDNSPPGTGSANTRSSTLLRRPDLWPRLPVYIAIYLLARCLGTRRYRRGMFDWSRDATSRKAAEHGPARELPSRRQ